MNTAFTELVMVALASLDIKEEVKLNLCEISIDIIICSSCITTAIIMTNDHELGARRPKR